MSFGASIKRSSLACGFWEALNLYLPRDLIFLMASPSLA